MNTQYEQCFERNIGIFTEEEQKQLKNSTVSIAGMGGVGGFLAERLIRLGVGCLKITDLGTFEPSNLNRQHGSTQDTLDKKKTDAVKEIISNINPEAVIHSDNNGITDAASADAFVEGSDIVIDEMDYGAWKESIYLQRAARKRGIHYLFSGAIGFGALLSNFDPKGITLEEYNGIDPDEDIEKMITGSVSQEKILPVVPSYTTDAMSPSMLHEIITGQRPVPTCSVGVGLASILAANEVVNTLLKRKEVITAPKYIYVDLMDKKFVTGVMG